MRLSQGSNDKRQCTKKDSLRVIVWVDVARVVSVLQSAGKDLDGPGPNLGKSFV